MTLRDAITVLLTQAEHIRALPNPSFYARREGAAIDVVINHLEEHYPHDVDSAEEQCAEWREQRRVRDGSNLDTID